MGNCGSKYTPAYCNGVIRNPLEADPDIVGPGVIVAFTTSALATFGAIVFGYLSNSLPEQYLNDTDIVVISWYRQTWLFQKTSTSIRTLLKSLLHHGGFTSRIQREKALLRFVLSLSDQQLVTGLSTLIGALTNHCNISIYELNVAVSLAWFSSLTHLATLDVLRKYFLENAFVRNVRVFFMAWLLALLISAQVLLIHYQTSSTAAPIQCLKGDFGESGFAPYDSSLPAFIALVYTILYLLFAYIGRIRRFFSYRDPTPFAVSVLARRGFGRAGNLDLDVSFLERVESLKAAHIAYTGKTIAKGDKFLRLPLMSTLQSYSQSFLCRIGALAFSGAYGITHLYIVLNFAFPSAGLSESSQRMGFGQIAPLVLLVIPLLALAEIYFEKSDQHHAVPARTGSPVPVAIDNNTPTHAPPSVSTSLSFFLIQVIFVVYLGLGLNLPIFGIVLSGSLLMTAYGAVLIISPALSVLWFRLHLSELHRNRRRRVPETPDGMGLAGHQSPPEHCSPNPASRGNPDNADGTP